ncbi:uncharacterized protein [Pocillopora verrucosa]|uniref:uncharacterized protein n=1 Tax=Pocillopora verrucosa TaxID=203993 RepID=UPI00333FED7B
MSYTLSVFACFHYQESIVWHGGHVKWSCGPGRLLNSIDLILLKRLVVGNYLRHQVPGDDNDLFAFNTEYGNWNMKWISCSNQDMTIIFKELLFYLIVIQPLGEPECSRHKLICDWNIA